MIQNAVSTAITNFASTVYNQLAADLILFGVPIVTLWILISGFRIITGASGERVGAYFLRVLKVFCLVGAATTGLFFNGDVRQTANDFRDYVTFAVTGNTTDVYTQIRTNLLLAATITSLVDAATGQFAEGESETKTSAATLAMVGAGAPAVVAGVTAMTLEAVISIGIMLQPIFFFFGIFERSSHWPFKWAEYMVGTMLATAVMAVTSSFCLGVMGAFALASIAAYGFGSSLLQMGIGLAGLGVIMSALMITIPGIVLKFFSLADLQAAAQSLGSSGMSGKKTSSGGFATPTAKPPRTG